MLHVRRTGNTHQRRLNAHAFCRRKGNAKITSLVVRPQRIVRNAVGQIRVHDGTKRQTIVPRRTKVGDVDVPVANRFILAPLKQSVALRTTILDQRIQWVFSFSG